MFYFQSLVISSTTQHFICMECWSPYKRPKHGKARKRLMICILMFESVKNHGGAAAPPSSNDSPRRTKYPPFSVQSHYLPKIIALGICNTHTLKLHIQLVDFQLLHFFHFTKVMLFHEKMVICYLSTEKFKSS